MAGMLVLVTAFVALHQRNRSLARREGPGTTTAATGLTGRPRLAAGIIAALTLVLAVVSAVPVDRIGDSGARAAWSNTQYLTSTPA